jgi:hypothetical protein
MFLQSRIKQPELKRKQSRNAFENATYVKNELHHDREWQQLALASIAFHWSVVASNSSYTMAVQFRPDLLRRWQQGVPQGSNGARNTDTNAASNEVER